MTRTHYKHVRCYVDGVDLSGYARSVGPLTWTFGAEPDAAYTDGCKNILIGQADIQAGALNAFLDSDTAGLYVNRAQGTQNLMVAIGVNAAPAAGNPIFAWKFEDVGYNVEPGSGFVLANLPFGGASYASTLTYAKPFGVLLYAKAARTSASGANTATGVDDYGASPPSLGGIFVYHLFSSDGTITLKAQEADANVDGSFADITGATSGAITAAVTPQHGMVTIATNYALKRYLRWQVAFGSATTATFVIGFIRNTIGGEPPA